MKATFTFFTILFCLFSLAFGDYTTPGTGVSWSLDSLVAHSGGVVSGGNHYFVMSQSVNVSIADRLLISAGDTLVFADQTGSLKLQILGFLQAEGTETDTVLITSQNKNYGDYAGIEFRDNTAADSSFLHYCILEYGTRTIRTVSTSPVIENCVVRHSSEAAVDIFNSSPTLRNCRIIHNRQYAVKMTSDSSPLIEGNYFAENNFQNSSPYVIITIGLQGLNSPVIRGNTIIGGYDKSGGIAIWNQSNAIIENNRIEDCAYGILCYQTGANPLIWRNTLLNNNINPDTLNFGFGIACNGPNHPVISGNTISGHYYGIAIINGGQPDVGDLSNADTTDDGGNRFVGNGIGDKKYELYNNNSLPIMAEGNWWGTSNEDSIEARIVHQPDNPAFGYVDFIPFLTDDPITQIQSSAAHLPQNAELISNYPNPFNSGTVIAFHLTKSEKISLSVFDILGRKVATLLDSYLPAGSHRVHWNGRDRNGKDAASGIYFYQLQTAEKRLNGRMVLLR